jgi:hypothetical protein
MRQFKPDGTRGGALADHDIQGVILHRRIEHLFDGAAQAVHFVNEQDVAGPQVGQDGRQIAGPLDRRTRGDLDIDPHFVGKDVRQGGFTQARRSIEQHVIDGLSALEGRCNQDRQVLFDPLLPDQIGEQTRPQGLVQSILGLRIWGDQALRGGIHRMDYN